MLQINLLKKKIKFIENCVKQKFIGYFFYLRDLYKYCVVIFLFVVSSVNGLNVFVIWIIFKVVCMLYGIV